MHFGTAHIVLVFVVYAFAVMRLTRLVNADSVASFVRLYPASKVRDATLRAEEASVHGRAVEAQAQHQRMTRWATVFEFVQCPWCVGWWFALLGAAAVVWVLKYDWTLDWWAIIPLALAASHLVGILARFADTEELEIEETEDDA